MMSTASAVDAAMVKRLVATASKLRMVGVASVVWPPQYKEECGIKETCERKLATVDPPMATPLAEEAFAPCPIATGLLKPPADAERPIATAPDGLLKVVAAGPMATDADPALAPRPMPTDSKACAIASRPIATQSAALDVEFVPMAIALVWLATCVAAERLVCIFIAFVPSAVVEGASPINIDPAPLGRAKGLA